VRLFLAINLDHQLRQEVHDATAPLREALPAAKWVAAPRLHLTLKFLGEQPEEIAMRIADAMTKVAARHRELAIVLGGVGAFPNLRRPRTVWMGVHPEPRLELLHHDIEVACEALGHELEGRPFRPHLTLARVRERPNGDEPRALSRAARRVDFEGEVPVRSIDLMSSELSANGPEYRLIAAAALRSD